MSVEKQILRIKELARNATDPLEITKTERSLIDHITLMEEILQSVPDVIGVLRPDYSIAFFNQSGYELFSTNREEVRQKKCYELFGRTSPCDFCIMEKVISEKKEQVHQEFVPEVGRFVDFFYKPVFDEAGNVELIIGKMRDITEQKVVEKKLQMQEASYRKIFENSPYGILIVRDGQMVMANSELVKLSGYKEEELRGMHLKDLLHKDYQHRADMQLHSLMNDKVFKIDTEVVIRRKDGKELTAEMTASKIDFLGLPAKQIIIKDISKIREEMNKASKIQRVRMEKYPNDLDKINFCTVYIPKNMVSGDFFHIFKTGEEEIVGFMGDSNGSGVSSALLNSAVKVIINDVITRTTDPPTFLNLIHEEFSPLFEEDFVSAICFKIDFAEKKIVITSAGINEYIIERKGSPTLSILKGPPIGCRVGNLSFDTIVHDFHPGDRLYLFTDGFSDKIQKQYFKEKKYTTSLEKQKQFVRGFFAKPDHVEDDVLWVGIENKNYPKQEEPQ